MQTLLGYIGENPAREGLVDTPRRVVEAFDELYQGYHQCPAEVLNRTFGETAGYDDFVLIRDIEFTSQCEHHMMPFYGKAHIAYTPVERVVGLSKLARLTDIFARRLQTQEHLTAQIAAAIDEILKPRGVAVVIEAEHTCMSVRGVAKHGAMTFTSRYTGMFRDNPAEQARFLSMVRGTHATSPRLKSRGTARVHILPEIHDIEEGLTLQPKFDASGLVTCVATDAVTGEVLMVAHMNDEALRKTIASGRGLVLQPLAPGAVAQRRKLRPRPARGRDADGLRSGRDLDPGRADRRGLPHRPPLLFLPRGERRPRAARNCRFVDAEQAVRSEGGLSAGCHRPPLRQMRAPLTRH